MLLHVSFLLIKLEYGKSKGEILNFTNTRQQFDTRTMKMDTDFFKNSQAYSFNGGIFKEARGYVHE